MNLLNAKYLLLAFFVVATVQCTSKKDDGAAENTRNTLKHIIVELESKSGSEVTGKVEFIEVETGVQVKVDVKGLTANSKHGFHVHEKPDCSPADATGAGGHFNPQGHDHGEPNTGYHAGDLGNLETDENGNAKLDQVFTHISLQPADPAYIVNRAVVVHADEDDFSTQPTGNAGARVACGTITL